MADKRVTFGFFAKDNGVERTLDKIGQATADAAEETGKLAKEQLELRESALAAERASDRLASAQARAVKVSKLAAASDMDKRKAAQAVEAAEIGHQKALLKVADAADRARKSTEEAGDAAEHAGDRAAGGTKGFLSLTKNLGGGLKAGLKVGLAALLLLALSGGVAAGTAFVKGMQSVMAQQDATAKLKVQLGLTEAESARVGKVAGQVYAGAYGESLEQVRDAVRSVVQDGAVLNGAMSRDLGDVTGKVLNLANTFGEDLGGVTRAVGQMLRTGMAKDADQALDILTRGMQTGADKAGDLLDTFNEYPTQFRRLGLSGEQAMGLISQGLKAGARDSDIAADALKEFGIRAVDGSTTTADGFKRLGLNADDMAHKIAAGGKTAAGGLDLTLDRLRRIKDPVERAQVAVELFGTQSEDMAAALGSMDLSTATTQLGNVKGAADRMGDALTTPAAKLESLKRTLELKVQGWLVQAFDWFNAHRLDIADGLLDVADGAVALIQPLAATASVGMRVGQALLYVASAAQFAKGHIAQGRELAEYAGKLGDAAGKAWDLGGVLERKASPAVDALRAKVAAMRSKQITITAVDNATKAAQRVRGELAKVPAYKSVTVQVSDQGSINLVQRQIDSISGHAVAIQVGRVGYGVAAMADGGQVRGPGGPRGDKIPAMLSDREYVMPAEQTDRYLPFLEAMRDGRVSLMAGGGQVGTGRPVAASYAQPELLQPIVLQLDGRSVWQGLVAVRRNVNGGRPLGIG